MTRRISTNPRKKRAENMIVDFWAIVIFVLVVVLFFILFWATRKEPLKDAEAHFRNKDAGVMLNGFIRAPYMYDTRKSIGDVMTRSLIEGDTANLDKAFDEFYSGIDIYSGGFEGKDYYSSRIINRIAICVFDENNDKLYFREKIVSATPSGDDFKDALDAECEAVANIYLSSSETILPSYGQNLRVVLNVFHYPKET